MSDSNDLLPVRMLTQYAYCKRLGYLEWVQGEFAYNKEVVEGKYAHRIVDQKSGTKKMEQGAEETIHARSVTLSDPTSKLISKIDLLELTGNNAIPVEYKRGNTPKDGVPYKDHIVQICAQGLLLRANGYECTEGVIYYVASHQRVKVEFNQDVVSMTQQLIKEMQETASQSKMPPPLDNSPKCHRCSLVGICLPDETNMLTADSHINKDHVRRMYPVRKDSVPLYVQEQGARVGKSGDCIHITLKGKIIKKIKLIDISELTVYGQVQVTTQAIRELCSRNIPICYMTYGGWFSGMVRGTSSKNIELRIHQHKKYENNKSSMKIARAIVFGKIKNSSTILRRNHKSPPIDKIDELDRLAEKSRTTKQYETLLGVEGMAARIYFSEFNGMIKNEFDFDFTGRNRRPPKDPINAILSFLYSLLTRQAITIVSMVGLDPYLGFLHRPKYGKPALALDIIEEFRPIVADSVCLRVINGGEISSSDFIKTDFGVNMTNSGRIHVIKAYERRMDSTIVHPLLGYSASYKRVMETQARLLSRHILDEIPTYPAFRTR